MSGRRDYDHLCSRFRVARTADGVVVGGAGVGGSLNESGAGSGWVGSISTNMSSGDVNRKRQIGEDKDEEEGGEGADEDADSNEADEQHELAKAESTQQPFKSATDSKSTTDGSIPKHVIADMRDGAQTSFASSSVTECNETLTPTAGLERDESVTIDASSAAVMLKLDHEIYSQNITAESIATAVPVPQPLPHPPRRDSVRRAWSSVGPLKTQYELSSRFRVVDERQLHRVRGGVAIDQYVLSFPSAASVLEPISSGQPQQGPPPPASALMSKFRGVHREKKAKVHKKKAVSSQ
ncbi:uncharacterized protein V2V93DRAFT_374699 [Kockiozyma suomiensis]|uniref:uncharacterized protein n=1 Tax=Kockiozyma suomiensis TaxID=1337062 RepID=UPI003343ADE7